MKKECLKREVEYEHKAQTKKDDSREVRKRGGVVREPGWKLGATRSKEVDEEKNEERVKASERQDVEEVSV